MGKQEKDKEAAHQAYLDKVQAAAVAKSKEAFYNPKPKTARATHRPSKYIPRIGADKVMRKGSTLRSDWDERKKLQGMSASERARYKARKKAKHLGSPASN